MFVSFQGNFDVFRVKQMIQDKAQSADYDKSGIALISFLSFLRAYDMGPTSGQLLGILMQYANEH